MSCVLRSHSTTVLLCLEAVETQNRASAFLHWTWLEGNFAVCTALCAGSREHFASGKTLLFALVAAVLATLRGCELLGSVEFLFASGERECCTAVAAGDLLIIHKDKEKKNRNCIVSFFSCSYGLTDLTDTKVIAW